MITTRNRKPEPKSKTTVHGINLLRSAMAFFWMLWWAQNPSRVVIHKRVGNARLPGCHATYRSRPTEHDDHDVRSQCKLDTAAYMNADVPASQGLSQARLVVAFAVANGDNDRRVTARTIIAAKPTCRGADWPALYACGITHARVESCSRVGQLERSRWALQFLVFERSGVQRVSYIDRRLPRTATIPRAKPSRAQVKYLSIRPGVFLPQRWWRHIAGIFRMHT